MEFFDYSQNCEDMLSIDVDSLSPKEVRQVNQAITTIKQNSSTIRQQNSLIWFNTALLPILQDYAELTSSFLQVEPDDTGIIIATIKNSMGLDIGESHKCMKMLLGLATHIGVNIDNGQATLNLVFECSEYIG